MTTEQKPEIKYQRMGDKGVSTITYPDGTWHSVCLAHNDFLEFARKIQDSNKEPNVVNMRGPGPGGVA